jgi:hypothetical protein
MADLKQILFRIKLGYQDILAISDTCEGHEEASATRQVAVVREEEFQCTVQVVYDVELRIQRTEGPFARFAGKVQSKGRSLSWNIRTHVRAIIDYADNGNV